MQEVTSTKISIPSSLYFAACYPFALELPEGVKAYVVSETATSTYDGETYEYAVLDSIEGNIVPANMPVILHGAKATYTMNIIADDNTTIEATNLLKGATVKRAHAKETFLATLSETSKAGTTGIIKMVASSTQVSANKSYLMKEDVDNATELYLAIRSSLTGIDNIEADENATEKRYYNLDGTEARKLESGRIYITSDGKKIYVK